MRKSATTLAIDAYKVSPGINLGFERDCRPNGKQLEHENSETTEVYTHSFPKKTWEESSILWIVSAKYAKIYPPRYDCLSIAFARTNR